MADDVTRYDTVEGYCSQLSYAPGDTVELHAACRGGAFDVTVERWGARREPVWSTRAVIGTEPATPADADSAGCGWPVSVEIPVAATWRSGFYLVTMTAADGPGDRRVAHAGFIVRARSRQADILFVPATNTWNAYNNWGGRSLYTGGNRVSFARPWGRGMLWRDETDRDDRKARPAYRDEKPDVDGEIYQAWRAEHGYPPYVGSAGWFTYERRFVEWAEAAGYTMDYAASSDIDRDPSIAAGYRLVVGVGHDEYWSAGQRATIEAHLSAGGNYASFSGNTMFWQVRLEDDARAMRCHKYSAHLDDPVLGTPDEPTMSGLWCDPIVGRPESLVLGAASVHGLYYRFGPVCARGAGAFTVSREGHWMLAGTGLRYGELLGARDMVVGYETVGCRLQLDEFHMPVAIGDHMPPETTVVAWAPSSNLGMGDYPASISALDDQGDLEFLAERYYGRLDDETIAKVRYGTSVMLTCRPFGADGGEVATIGTTDWVFGLAGDPAIGQVTRNVLDRFSAG